MEELARLVRRAQAGDGATYDGIVRRFESRNIVSLFWAMLLMSAFTSLAARRVGTHSSSSARLVRFPRRQRGWTSCVARAYRYLDMVKDVGRQ